MTPDHAWAIAPQIVSLMYWNRKRQFQLSEDRYEEGWVVFAIERGRMLYEIGSHRGEAGAGDLVFCPPGMLFGRKVVEPLSFFAIILQWFSTHDGQAVTDNLVNRDRFTVSKDSIDNRGASAGKASHLGDMVPAGKVSIRDRERLESNFAYLRETWEGATPQARSRQNFLLHDIWQMICYENSKSPSRTTPTSDSLMETASSIMKAEAYRPFSMKGLADRLELSPIQLSRRFKAAFAMTPSEYLADLRMQRAKSLLTETALTLEEIAARCGYDNGFYLSRVFSKKLLMSPKQYRRLHRM